MSYLLQAIGATSEIDFIAMEYVSGQTLDRLIGPRGIPLPLALDYAVQISDALSTAHEVGIIHRDLKPANVMITERREVKLLDFGLAKLIEPPTNEFAVTETVGPQTDEGRIMGTVAYMSPEQAHGKELDARSDIFSFGVVLYEMLCGQRPFQGGSPIEILSAIIQREPKPISELRPELPRDLERIVALALRKQPDRRFQHMADVKVELQALKEESDAGTISAVTGVSGPRARRRIPVALAAILGIVTIAAVLWYVSRPKPTTERSSLIRLTSDSGLTTDPALSLDGKLLAFASNRGGNGHLNLWVRQVAAGEPIRLTVHDADDSEPCFSPDGAYIAFHSETDGGIYVVPALGGEARLLARPGRRPRYSPDGKWITYWVGPTHVPMGEIYVVPSAGGSARKLQFRPVLPMAKYPVWSPDGALLLFLAGESALESRTLDWWIASVDDGRAVKTGAFDALRRQQLAASMFTAPQEWRSDQVLFSARAGDSTALWRIPLSVTSRQITHSAKQITFSTGLHISPSTAAGGRLAFASVAENIDIWSLPVDANQGKSAVSPNA